MDRRERREDRRGRDAQPGAAAGDEGGRRQVRRRRADPPVRAPVRRGDEARGRATRALPGQARGLHEGYGRDRDRVRRRPRHRQVARQHDPDQQRLHGRRPRQAGPDLDDPRRGGRARRDRDRAERAAGLDLEADAGLRPGAARATARVPGPDRRRRDQPQLRPADPVPERDRVRRDLRARRLLLQGRVRGAGEDGPAGRPRGARGADREDPCGRATPSRAARRRARRRAAGNRRLGPQRRPHRQPGPRAAVLGRARARGPARTRSTPTSTRTSCSSSTGVGAASRARSGRGCCATTSSRGSSVCGASRTTCTRARCSVLPVQLGRQRADRLGSRAPPASASSSRLVFPRQPRHDRICLADFYRPLGTELDVVALQAVTAGERGHRADGVARGRWASSPSSCSSTASACRRPRGWPNGCTRGSRSDLGIGPAQGRRYSWGYPSCPEQSEHDQGVPAARRALDRPALSGGYAVEPEQSTLAIVAHHPQAVYFGMRSGIAAAQTPSRRTTS